MQPEAPTKSSRRPKYSVRLPKSPLAIPIPGNPAARSLIVEEGPRQSPAVSAGDSSEVVIKHWVASSGKRVVWSSTWVSNNAKSCWWPTHREILFQRPGASSSQLHCPPDGLGLWLMQNPLVAVIAATTLSIGTCDSLLFSSQSPSFSRFPLLPVT